MPGEIPPITIDLDRIGAEYIAGINARRKTWREVRYLDTDHPAANAVKVYFVQGWREGDPVPDWPTIFANVQTRVTSVAAYELERAGPGVVEVCDFSKLRPGVSMHDATRCEFGYVFIDGYGEWVEAAFGHLSARETQTTLNMIERVVSFNDAEKARIEREKRAR